MNSLLKYQFITEYTTQRGEFHQCFEVFGSPIDSGNTETAKAECIEHIKNLLRSHGCLLTRLWVAYSNLTIDELQEITDGKLPANSKGQVVTLEEIDI